MGTQGKFGPKVPYYSSKAYTVRDNLGLFAYTYFSGESTLHVKNTGTNRKVAPVMPIYSLSIISGLLET